MKEVAYEEIEGVKETHSRGETRKGKGQSA